MHRFRKRTSQHQQDHWHYTAAAAAIPDKLHSENEECEEICEFWVDGRLTNISAGIDEH